MAAGSVALGAAAVSSPPIRLTLVALVAMMSASAAATASTLGIGPAGIGPGHRRRPCHRARRHRRAVWTDVPGGRPRTCGPRWDGSGGAMSIPVRLHQHLPDRRLAGPLGGRSARPRSARRRHPSNPARPCQSHRRRGRSPAWTGPCRARLGGTGRRPPRRRTSTRRWAPPWGRRQPLGKRCIVAVGPGAGMPTGRDNTDNWVPPPVNLVRDLNARPISINDVGEDRATTWPPGSRQLISRGPVGDRRAHRLGSRPLPQWRGHHRRQFRTPA